jgi:methionyl aminopeptidase
MITCKGKSEILKMERAARIVHETLTECVAAAVEGTTTEEIDRVAAAGIKSRGGRAAFPGYHGYPKTICISVNDEVVHGIPSPKKRLKSGDVVGFDLGAIVDGYYADAARTISVGTVDNKVRTLIETTHAALTAGIEAARVGARIGDIGAAVEAVARPKGYGVVREYVGHGIGTALHEEPQVPNYGPAGKREVIREGMTLAIEPMFNLGTAKVERGKDGWTVRTADGKVSAHFEHTIAITAQGPVVLGFGRFVADSDRIVPGVPFPFEYPVAAPVRDESAASIA